MRRIPLVSACLGALVFSGTSTALAKGPHHRGYARHGHGYHHRHANGGWYGGYRGGYGGYCGPRAAYYPTYPAYAAPYYGPGYSNFGFGVGGRNFSLWVQQ